MSRDAPEQLQIEFGRIDPISELYPRRHDYRPTNTSGELAGDALVALADFVTRPKVAGRIMGALSIAAATSAFFIGWKAKDVYEDYERTQKTVYEADDYIDDFVDCSDGVEPNLADLNYDRNFDYAGLYTDIALFDLESWGNLRIQQIFANSIGAKEAADLLDSYLVGSPVKITYDINWEKEEEYSGSNVELKDRINRAGIENLGIAMYSIPKTLYEYAGIKEIRIVEEIKSPKSEEQLVLERKTTTPPYVVDEYNYYGGQYREEGGVVLIPKSALKDGSQLMKIFFHEVIGHGVMMANCEPFTDSDWHDLNMSTDIDFRYMPGWKRTSEVDEIFESGILVHGSYAGTNPREDVAETSTILAPPFPLELKYSGQVWSQNGTIVDEKANLIFDRVSEIEPGLGRFLALQYEMATLSATGSYDELLDAIEG